MDGQPLQPPASLSATQVVHMRFYKDDLQELIRRCEECGEVTVAVRAFPSDQYQWCYARSLVLIARARLEASGRVAQVETVMDSKQSRIVLIVGEPERCAVGDVGAKVANIGIGTGTSSPMVRSSEEPDRK